MKSDAASADASAVAAAGNSGIGTLLLSRYTLNVLKAPSLTATDIAATGLYPGTSTETLYGPIVLLAA